MGNMSALRDWGHAKDYVRMQWMMLQQDKPQDFVIATGVQYSVRQFITWTAAALGITVAFEGQGVDEVAVVKAIHGDKAPALKVGDVVVRVDPRYFRPTEVQTLLGDPAKPRPSWAGFPRSPRRTCVRKWWPATWRTPSSRPCCGSTATPLMSVWSKLSDPLRTPTEQFHRIATQ
jgi:GDP-mannose 4,6-dehydratase